ncbi:MAG TPA: hypothetical protein VJP76_01325, partial [Candidatus Tumulicola sp.]|nr:hypothetical protein [Candidatus Tumulicola sp.]
MHAFDTLGGFKAAVHQSIVDHYQLAGPLMEALFGGTPLVYVVYPRGLGNYAVYHGALHTPAPAHLRTIDVPQAQGLTTYIAFAPRAVEWLLAHTSTVEFHGWGCAAEDPTIARFGRILLELDREHGAPLIEAVHVVRERLREAGLQAVPLLQSTRGLALWIPLAGVRYAPLLGWLNAFCAAVARDNPLLFSLEPNTVASGRVHLHVSSNAPGRNSGLPYSLRGDAELHVAAPVEWDELGALTPIAAKDFPARLSATGDLFRRQTEAIGLQQLPELEPHRSFDAADSPQHRRPIESHGRILQAAAEILADGKPRDAQTILTEAVARRLLPPDTKQKYVYTALLEYIVRSSGHGHKPFLVQDVDRRFRVNEPLDEWPAADLPPLPPPDAATLALIDRLESTGRGSDPTAFELAVCDAFAHLGFIATHVGGYQNPDGYADAPLGVDGYRT